MNIKNTFNGGMDTDTSINKYPKTSYYNAKNLRIVTRDGLNKYALSSIPSPSVVLSDSAITTNGNIVGSTNIRNISVIFLQNIADSTSEIYKIDYSSLSFDLIYTDKDSTVKLNFDIDNPIQAVGRYESESIQKVYWCDGVEVNRFINIEEDHQSGGVYNDATLLSITPNVDLNTPIITSVGSGGTLLSGSISYAYQLYKINGNETTVSPVSPLLPLSSRNGNTLSNFRGDEVDTDTGNSVTINVSDLDLNFNRIRIYSLHYADADADPTISAISEFAYTNDSISYTDNGVSSLYSLTTSEFIALGGTVFSSKTLASKKNYLFPGNITEIKSDIDFDARAYRFNASSEAVVYDSDLTGYYTIQTSGAWVHTDGSSGSDWTIPYDADCINRFNDLDEDIDISSYDYEHTASNYPYEFNTSLEKGGTGPNVSYEFTSTDIEANVIQVSTSTAQLTRKINDKDNSFLNPLNVLNSVGYKRGEVYRFGLEFQFRTGEVSYVEWIGDIRMPPVNEPEHKMSYTDGVIIKNKQLGVSFTVDLSSIDSTTLDSLSGFRIVRVELDSSDQNILCQGLGGALFQWEGYTTDIDPWLSYSRIPSASEYDGAAISIGDTGITSPQTPTLNQYLLEINSPDISFNKDISYKSGDSLRVVGIMGTDYQTSDSYVAYDTEDPDGFIRERSYGFSLGYKIKDTVNVSDFKLSELRYGESSAYDTLNSEVIAHRCAGVLSGSDFQNSYESFRGSCGYVSVEMPFSFDETEISFTTDSHYILEYIRNRFGSQYGGYTYNSRLSNTYISTATDDYKTFIPISDLSASSDITINVYGGDTFVSNFDQMRSGFDKTCQDLSRTTDSAQEYITFPVESKINCDYRRDEIIKYYTGISEFDDTNGSGYMINESYDYGVLAYPDDYPSDLTDLYLYNDAYSRQNDTQTGSPEPFDFSDQTDFDTKVMTSDKKYNGEYIDSWTTYETTSFLEVEADKGPLNRLINYKDNLIFFQDNGVGSIAVEDRAQVSTDSGSTLTLGTGANLERFDYISTSFGAQDANSVFATPNNLYFIDASDKSIRILSKTDDDGNLSQIRNTSKYVYDNITSDSNVRIGYDPINKEVLFTIDDTSLVFNEQSKTFVSEYDIISDQQAVTESIKVGEYVELNGELYSTVFDRYDSLLKVHKFNASTTSLLGDNGYITLIVNPNETNIFKFDVLELRVNVFDSIGDSFPTNDNNTNVIDRITYQNSYLPAKSVDIVLNDNLQKVARVMRTKVPLTSNLNRYVDSYLMLTIRFDNSLDVPYVLHDITTHIRQSKV